MTDNVDNAEFVRRMLTDMREEMRQLRMSLDAQAIVLGDFRNETAKRLTVMGADIHALAVWRHSHDDLEQRLRRIEEHVGLR